jgi:hypothetical protein
MSARVSFLMGDMSVVVLNEKTAWKNMQIFTAIVLIFLTARVDWKLTKVFGLTLTAVGTTA